MINIHSRAASELNGDSFNHDFMLRHSAEYRARFPDDAAFYELGPDGQTWQRRIAAYCIRGNELEVTVKKTANETTIRRGTILNPDERLRRVTVAQLTNDIVERRAAGDLGPVSIREATVKAVRANARDERLIEAFAARHLDLCLSSQSVQARAVDRCLREPQELRSTNKLQARKKVSASDLLTVLSRNYKDPGRAPDPDKKERTGFFDLRKATYKERGRYVKAELGTAASLHYSHVDPYEQGDETEYCVEAVYERPGKQQSVMGQTMVDLYATGGVDWEKVSRHPKLTSGEAARLKEFVEGGANSVTNPNEYRNITDKKRKAPLLTRAIMEQAVAALQNRPTSVEVPSGAREGDTIGRSWMHAELVPLLYLKQWPGK